MAKMAILALAAALLAGEAAAQNLPAGVEGLRGRHWRGGECCGWSWDWTQVNGPTFRGSFRNTNGQVLNEEGIIISIRGERVEITRGGGSAMGGCTYEGTIRGATASGNYSCRGAPAGQWSAHISQAVGGR
jgi:hypothetical protein